jgi:hypothetical protein
MRILAASLLLFCGPLWADPNITLPAEVAGQPAAFIQVPATTKGKTVRWVSIDPGLNLFPAELLKDTRTAVVSASAPGRYRLLAYSSLNGEPTEAAQCVVVVGTPEPTPPVPPGPQPPGPQPPVPPAPGGLRVLLIYETADVQRLPAQQSAVLFGKAVRDYLDAKCATGGDGRTREWRALDKDADSSTLGVTLQSMFKRPRQSVPWIVISTDKGGYEGPLPATVDAALALLQQYGGK